MYSLPVLMQARCSLDRSTSSASVFCENFLDFLYFLIFLPKASSLDIKTFCNNNKNSTTYKTFNGKSNINLTYFDDGQFVLNDGSLILIENDSPTRNLGIYISVDVNGFKKNPNRLGWDLFMFQIDDKGRLLPMGAKGADYYNKNDAYCSPASTHNMNGAGCTYKALSEKDYFSKLNY